MIDFVRGNSDRRHGQNLLRRQDGLIGRFVQFAKIAAKVPEGDKHRKAR